MGFYGLDNPNPNTAQGVFPRRGGAQLSGTCIMHTAESVLDNIGDDSGAEDCAAFIMRRTDYGCYHSLVDSDSIIEIYPYEWECWQDSETNNWAVGISAACRTSDWATMGEAKREGFYRNLAWCAADFVNYMATKGITVPLRRISGAEARARVPGFCAHGDSGISRSDPGINFDWNRFFTYTKQALDGVVTKPVEEDEMGVLDERVKQVGGGEVTLREVISEFRAHQMQTRTVVSENAAKVIAAVAAAAANDGNTLEEIQEAVKKAIADNVLTVDVNLAGKAATD